MVEKLRYAPHGAARSLITRETHTLGVLLPDLFGEFFSELIRGIDATARRRGYHLLYSGSHGDRSEAEAMVRAMRGRVDGLIVLSPDGNRGALRANVPENFPVVLLNSAGGGRSFDTIAVDNFGGAAAMVRHLAGLGHRRVAFIAGPPGNRDASERLRGYREAMRSVGEWSKELEIPGNFREEAGYEACARIRGLRPRPSAVFAANDSMAIGLLYACREAGLRVPEDLAIAGFDDGSDRRARDLRGAEIARGPGRKAGRPPEEGGPPDDPRRARLVRRDARAASPDREERGGEGAGRSGPIENE